MTNGAIFMSNPIQTLKAILAFLKHKAQNQAPVDGLYMLGDGERSPSTSRRQRANEEAVKLLRGLESQGMTSATDEQKRVLSQYTGTGGNLIDEAGLKGSPFEYYTPTPVAKAMWSLLAEYGVGNSSKVLDPSSGTGVFAATAPAGTLMHSVELSDVSGGINRLVNDSPTHSVTVSPFEQVASNTDDETFDVVITNVPFGTNSSRGKNKLLDPRYQGESLEVYFILRSLDKLKPGGLAMFITPAKIMSSGQFSKFRQQMSLRAELIGAYRLPNKVFAGTGADVTTDIIVLKKFGREAGEKISSLYGTGQIDLLSESRVLDAEILKGRYFQHEGRKFMLGHVEEGKGRFGMVERVVNDQSLANILALVKRFPESRINWSMLNAVNADLPDYQDGDQQVMDGMTFERKAGQWVQVQGTVPKVDESRQETPYGSFLNAVTLDELQAAVAQGRAMGKKPDPWKAQLLEQAKSESECRYWLILASVQDALEKAVSDTPLAELFPELTAAMRGVAASYNHKTVKPTTKWARDLTKRASIAFDEPGSGGISDYWMSNRHAVDDIEVTHAVSAKAAYDRLLYEGGADNFGVSIEELSDVYPDFDPYSANEFCLAASLDRVVLSRDYYVGNCQELLSQIDQALDATDDPKIRSKLLSQREEAVKRIPHSNVREMSFTLRSTMVPMELKAEFLRQFGDEHVQLDSSGLDPKLVMQGAKLPTLEDVISRVTRGASYGVDPYLTNRILDALNNNSRLSLRVGKSSDVSKADHDTVFNLLKRKYQDLNLSFDAWLKADPVYMANLEIKINSPSMKVFSPELDDSPIEIDGFNPKMPGFKGLNGYQNEEIRRQTRRMEGICGFDVGLGKTLTALAAVHNMHNMGVKKRTFIVVPNHTISKWLRDAKMAYDNTDDLLVIGSNDNQQEVVNSSNYGKDLALLLKKPYRKVLMTVDAFTMIPLRSETVSNYFRKDARNNSKAAAIAAEGDLAELGRRLGAAAGTMPYFEELGVDSLVFDEAQLFKNGKTSEGEFARIKGLSLLAEDALSTRALSAAVKSAYVRGMNREHDGVMLLTATPFTNSPVEILTMLSLSVGDREALNMLGGSALTSVDDFLSNYANIEEVDCMTIAGLTASVDTFTGFKNVKMLKEAIHGVANIQTARERNLRIPDQNDQTVAVTLNDADKASLDLLKHAYLQAKELKNGGGMMDTKALQQVMQLTGESETLLGHPFNLISRMSDVIVMGAEMGMTRTIILSFDPAQAKQVENLVDKYNAKKFKVKTSRNYPSVDRADVLKIETGKQDDVTGDGESGALYTLQARATIQDSRIVLNMDDSAMLGRFMEMAASMKVNLNPVLSSKALAMLDNVKAELAMPKTASRSKQLIFCDMLPMHHLIKSALVQQCGIPAGEIAIINAQTLPDGKPGNPSTEEVQFIQDQFKDGAFTIVIANRKAETGIDLQHGTQAIHHLTTGWTPDSITQRNGRGVRQGNQLDQVNVYYYNADGTFDEYKRNLINAKSDWIDSLMSKDAAVGGTLKVAQELTKQDYEDLISADSPEAVKALMEARETRQNQEREARIKSEIDRRLNAYRAAVENDRKNKPSEILEQVTREDMAAYMALQFRLMHRAKNDEEKAAVQAEIDGILAPWKMIDGFSIERFERAAKNPKELKYSAFTKAVSPSATAWLQDTESHSNPLHVRVSMRKQQITDMVAAMRESFLSFEDSGLSVEDRALAIDGKLAMVDGDIFRDGEILKAVSPLNGKNIYSMAVVEDGKFIVFKANSNVYKEFKKIDPSDYDSAIEHLARIDAERIKERGIYSVLDINENYLKRELFLSRVPDLTSLVDQKLSDMKKAKEKQVHSFYYDRLVMDLDSSSILYWPELSDDMLDSVAIPENKELRKRYNAPFDEAMIKVEDGRVYFQYDSVLRLRLRNVFYNVRTSLFDSLKLWCIARQEKLNIRPEDADLKLEISKQMLILFANRKSNDYAKVMEVAGVNPTDINKEELPKIYRAALGFQFDWIANLDAVHEYLLKSGTYEKNLDRALPIAGQKPWEGLVRNGNVAVKSHYGYGDDRNFILVYKEEIKKKAKQIEGGYATFRGSDKAWVYSVPVLEWISSQDWYDESAITFLKP